MQCKPGHVMNKHLGRTSKTCCQVQSRLDIAPLNESIRSGPLSGVLLRLAIVRCCFVQFQVPDAVRPPPFSAQRYLGPIALALKWLVLNSEVQLFTMLNPVSESASVGSFAHVPCSIICILSRRQSQRLVAHSPHYLYRSRCQ